MCVCVREREREREIGSDANHRVTAMKFYLHSRSQFKNRNVQRFRGGLVFKAHRLLYHSTLGLRVIKKKRRMTSECSANHRVTAMKLYLHLRSQFKNNHFTEMCSGSEARSYLRLIDFVYHSTLGLREITKKRMMTSDCSANHGVTAMQLYLHRVYGLRVMVQCFRVQGLGFRV